MTALATSRIPATLDALVALCAAQTGAGGRLAGVEVVDGPPVAGATSTAERVLYVGDTPDDNSAAVTGNQDYAALGRRARDETFSVYCTAVARSGDTDIRAERDRAFAIVGAVEDAVRADPTLGGVLLWASVAGDETYTPIQTDRGAYVEVMFTVVCRARI